MTFIKNSHRRYDWIANKFNFNMVFKEQKYTQLGQNLRAIKFTKFRDKVAFRKVTCHYTLIKILNMMKPR